MAKIKISHLSSGCYRSVIRNRDAMTEVAELAIAFFRENAIPYPQIAVSGTSGILPAVLLNYEAGYPFVIIRKEKENSHGSPVEHCETIYQPRGVWILDDFIASGETVDRMANLLISEGYTVDGIILYAAGNVGYPNDYEKLRSVKTPSGYRINIRQYNLLSAPFVCE